MGWLYANDGLFEKLDLSKIPNSKNLAAEAQISPYHLGSWAYVYTIGYRPDLLKGVKFESWNDLWNPALKGMLAAPDFDPVTSSWSPRFCPAAMRRTGKEAKTSLKP